ncbi:MAG: papain-like cysteine protease family protein [Tepidisphaeraceae bacterium]
MEGEIMKRSSLLVFGAAVLAAASVSQAAYPYGDNSQINGSTAADDYAGASVTPDSNGNPRAPQACAPTATVNSFEMLQNEYGVTGLVGSDPYDAINDLASDMSTQGDAYYNPASPGYHAHDAEGNEIHTGGTSAQNLVNGKVQYIQDNQTGGPEIEVHGQGIFGTFNADGTVDAAANGASTVPTDEYLQEQMAAGQDVEVWEAWVDPNLPGGDAGAHIITITGIDSEAGTIDFVDPWGGVDVNATFDLVNTTNYGVNGDYMRITYPGPDDGGDDAANPDDPADEMSADIAMVVAESPVPEPAMIGMLVIGCGMLAFRRTRRTATN